MVGILLITHGDIGRSLLNTAKTIVSSMPAQVDTLSVSNLTQPEQLCHIAQSKIRQLDQGNGVLVLTDLYGATPHNIAKKLCKYNVSVVSGLNLSMLLRTINYAHCSLDQMTVVAEEGGHVGIKCDSALTTQPATHLC